jgi:hypothetical protein
MSVLAIRSSVVIIVVRMHLLPDYIKFSPLFDSELYLFLFSISSLCFCYDSDVLFLLSLFRFRPSRIIVLLLRFFMVVDYSATLSVLVFAFLFGVFVLLLAFFYLIV